MPSLNECGLAQNFICSTEKIFLLGEVGDGEALRDLNTKKKIDSV